MAATISSALQAPRISRVTASAHVYTVPVVRELPVSSGDAPGTRRIW
jgi:hypothetical protein